jgi:hypothetical protein
MRRPRVRHHTDDAGLRRIQAAGAINPARGWAGLEAGRYVEVEAGVHVEVEPFGSARTGPGGPAAEMGCFGEGAYVEFDAPAGPRMRRYTCGPRNTAIIPTPVDQPLSLAGLNAVYRAVRRHWWEFWRAPG